MSTFTLTSEKHFLKTHIGGDIQVYEYMDDPNVFDMIHASDSSHWHDKAIVGTSRKASFQALELFGVTIDGSQLKELVKDLTITDASGQTFHLVVNRQGLCFMDVGSPPIVRLRMNDHFGWSKYGVKPQISTIWNIWDMNNGAILLASPTSSDYKNNINDDESAGGWKKLVEDKDKQLASLKTALKKLCDCDDKQSV